MTPIFSILVFFVGACVGSFLNVCIGRWPANESVVRPRSRCPRCARMIAWYDNIPILSWIALRAKCRNCGEPISWQYPIVEAAVGLIWLGFVWWLGPSFTALRLSVFATILLGVAVTDAQHYLIPDGFTVSGLLLVATASVAGVVAGFNVPFADPADALFGACVGAGAITIIGWLGEVALKKEAMGFGDSTLMAMAGAALGPGRALLTIFLAALIAAAAFLLVVYPVTWWRARAAGGPFEPPLVPFGVFLSPAAMVALLWGHQLIAWYLQRFVP